MGRSQDQPGRHTRRGLIHHRGPGRSAGRRERAGGCERRHQGRGPDGKTLEARKGNGRIACCRREHDGPGARLLRRGAGGSARAFRGRSGGDSVAHRRGNGLQRRRGLDRHEGVHVFGLDRQGRRGPHPGRHEGRGGRGQGGAGRPSGRVRRRSAREVPRRHRADPGGDHGSSQARLGGRRRVPGHPRLGDQEHRFRPASRTAALGPLSSRQRRNGRPWRA